MSATDKEGEKMRIWFKIYKDTRIINEETIEDYSEETRTHKIFNALEKACYDFDLQKPIWLDYNVKEFAKRGVTKFTKDNFVEEIEFDYLEMHILEE